MKFTLTVIPTKVGTQKRRHSAKYLALNAWAWVPTFVGMTGFSVSQHNAY
jgi:hypothetical protein